MSQYPQASPEALSVWRFRQGWGAKKASNVVGGQIRSFDVESGLIELAGQGESLIFNWRGDQAFLENLTLGDWVELVTADSPTRQQPLETNECRKKVPAGGELGSRPEFSQHCRWLEFLQDLRGILQGLSLQEVQTPQLVTCPGLEPTLHPFRLELKTQGRNENVYLPTSPELHLKKLLSQGFSDIFEITKCFRNDELSPVHEPEFWMLEWYRAFADLSLIQQDLQKILKALHEKKWVADAVPRLERVSVSELFQRFLEFRLTPQTTVEELRALCLKLGMKNAGDLSWNDCFHLLFVDRIEPKLSPAPLLVHSYPPSQRALARLNLEGWADRFEFYFRKIEIANAFHELNDPTEQRQRCAQDNEERRHLGNEVLPLDEEFLLALQRGCPPSAGIALGVERLFIACTGQKDLRATRLFPRFAPGFSRY